MKRATTLLLALLPLAASASESFTLNIPQRLDASQEIGEVRILLGLSAAPAGAQLVVGGTTTINLGATQTVAGDSVSFLSGAGNHVLIRYRPLSNFAGDFCAGGGAVPKDIALRFSGAQDVVDFRMSSFVVGAPAAECSDVSRRIADTPATITPTADGVAPALVATNMGRLELDVILVLDKSGSIAGLPPGAGPTSMTTKEMILKSAAEAFVATWESIDAPTGGVDWNGDRIAVTFFDNVAAPQTLAGADPPANLFLKRGNGWGPAVTLIDTLTPGNSTSIGAGINSAMEKWKADPVNDATVVVVTDGMQNTAPLIAATPSGFLGLTPVAGLNQELRKRFIPIQMIGFGTPATVDEELLRNISLETAGRSYMGVDAVTMFDVFAMTLVAVLKGNTASIATRAANPTTSKSVIVDPSARRVVFTLQWEPPSVNAFALEVLRPGSTTIATPTHARSLPQAAIQTFDKPDVGQWNVRVRRNKRLRTERVVPYTLNVFFLEQHLDYRLSVDRKMLRAEISYDGKPLIGLPAGALKVRMLRPKASLQSVLRRSKNKPRRATPGDPQTGAQLAALSLSPAEITMLRPAPAESLTLREDKRGVYSIALPPTPISGSYAYEIVLDWTDPRTGRVHREERLEQFVSEKR